MNISIIIPTYNRISLLTITLDSISNLTILSNTMECIVVDDGSTDSTLETVTQEYPWVRLVQQNHNGAPAARNLGLQKATGEYIVFLDSDDLLEPDFLEAKLYALHSDKNLAGAYGPFDYFREESGADSRVIIPRHTPYPIETTPSFLNHLKRLVGGWYIPCNAIVWRKEVLLRVGGQNEALKINQDVDLMFRILVNGNKIAGTHSGRALVRIHENERVGVIGKDREKFKQLYTLREDMFELLHLNGLDSPEIRENLARFCFNRWASNRKLFPQLATRYLKLSKKVYPNLKLKGNWYYRLLGLLIGSERAVKLKSFLTERYD